MRAANGFLFMAMTALAAWRFSMAAEDGNGLLRLSIVDAATGQPTSARVEVLDAKGKGYAAADAIPVGQGYRERKRAWSGNLEQALALLSRSFENPYTQTTQFYIGGNSRLSLPPGRYRMTTYKGTEYEVQTRDVSVQAGKTIDLSVAMTRWVNMPEKGWYSADDHLHISRPLPELNSVISKWMQAEDINVANLLQFGSSHQFLAAPQYAHGSAGVFRDGNYFLVAGQENPRTQFLGHALILGAQSAIHIPDRYLIYKSFWDESRRQGGLNGYAHWGASAGAPTGIAIDLPTRLLNFLEVLEAADANYDIWYDTLNSGYRLTPTAGTDYGSVPSIPGRERFYTEVKRPFTYAAWLDGIRRGRTFVTNGPVLEFNVEGKSIGDELVLEKPATVLVEARVRFDPARDDVKRMEIIRNGSLVGSFHRTGPPAQIRGGEVSRNGHVVRQFRREGLPSEIRCHFRLEIDETSWLAVRASGHKLGEAIPEGGLNPPFRDRGRGAYATHAHSAPIFVTVRNTPSLAHQPGGRTLARSWIARLDELESRLAEGNLKDLSEGIEDTVPNEALIRRNRHELLDGIATAKRLYREQVRLEVK